MREEIFIDGLIESLVPSLEDITGMLKAIANKARLKILLKLLEDEAKPKSFQLLMEDSGLKKTALSNHLSILDGMELISKPERGKYQATNDTKLLLSALNDSYEKSDRRGKLEVDKIQSGHFSDAFVKALVHDE